MALAALYDRLAPLAYGLALRVAGDRDLAEDTVQDTFLQFVRTIDRIDESYRVSSWIQRIAVNLCHDELRRRGRRKRIFEPASDVTELAMMAVADADRTRQPETAQAFGELHPRQPKVVLSAPELPAVGGRGRMLVEQLCGALADDRLLFGHDE